MDPAPAPAITAFHVRTLLGSPAEEPVLYIDTKEAPRIEVWTADDIRRSTIVVTRREVTGWIGEEPDDDAIHEVLPRLQDIADRLAGGS